MPAAPADKPADKPAATRSTKRTTLQCFLPGKHIALSGAALEFAQSDLAATAGAYNPALHEAPLVVGHPQTDAPAYGWVGALAHDSGALEATPRQVNPEFAALVNSGAFKKMSAAFWSPTAPGNPVPGVFYLRHIGFLGAAAPGVQGLRTPTFAGGDEGVVEFSAPYNPQFGGWGDVDSASLLRSLRDWLLGKFGQADADAALPGYLVGSVEREAQDELRSAQASADTTNTTESSFAPTPAFAQPQELPVTPAEKTALEADNAALRKQLADQAAAARKAQLAAAHDEGVAFAAGLVASSQLPDGQRDVVVGMFDAVAHQAQADGATVQFGLGDARAPLLPAIKALLGQLPLLVAQGQHATAARAARGAAGAVVAFAAAEGATVNPERLALHGQVLRYQAAKPGTGYADALAAVQAGLG